MYKTSAKQRITLIISGLILCIIVLEIGIRIGGFIFSSLQEYRNWLATKHKGTYRIMCLGESTTAGQYPPFLEEILNQRNIGVRFSVIDKGVIVTNTPAILLGLEENLNKYEPDMVVTMMGNNDEYIMYYQDIPEINTKLFQHCRVYRFIRLIYIHMLNKLKKAIELNLKTDTEYVRLGRIYQNQGKLSEAEELFKKAIELNPKNYWACAELTGLYRKQGKLSRAEEVLNKFLALNPKNDRVYMALANLYREMNRTGLAEECKKKGDELRLNEYSALTINNYHKLKEILDKRGIRLVCVQYPMCSIRPLKMILEGQEEIIFVDNEKIFKDAVKREGYKAYFTDMFAGEFGHCTPKGNRLLAENITNVILKEVFHK